MARALQASTAFTCGLVIFLGLVAQGMSAGFRFYSTLPFYVPVPFGENFKINCTTNGTNITTYLFFKKTGPWTALPNPLYPQVTIVKNGNIFTIVDFGIPDSGSYKCHANDSAGKSIEWPRGSTLIPNRNILPKMSIYPHTFLYKLEGQNANFTCQSAIKTDLTWYKMTGQTETQVAADKIVTQIEGYNKKVILMFKNAQLSDSGEYKCILSFKGKTRYELTALKILEIIPVKMISSSPQLTAGVGENVQFECIFEGYPLKPVQWFRNDKQIAVEACSNIIDNNYQLCGEHESSKYKSEFRAIEKYKRYNGTLTIRRTSYPSDQGIYQCRAGEKDQIQKADIFVNIHVKPILNKKESTLMVSSNTPAKISCMVDESNPMPTWTWQFQDRVCIAGSDSCEPSVGNWQPLPKTHTVEPSKSTASNISTISIPKGQKNTFYRCLANNRLGSDNFTKTLLRNDNVEPVKIKDSKVPRVYTAGVEPITLECQVLRQYAPIGVFWFKDNTSISHSQHSLGNVNKSLDDPYISLTLTVENTTTNDTGLYSCKLVLDQSKMDSVQVTVIARVAPNITGLVSQQVKMEDTQYIELRCDTQVANPPSKYTWYFTETKQLQPDIQPLKIGSNLDNREGCKSRTSGYYYLQSIKNAPLIICKPTHERHTGWYHCKAENTEGSDRKQAHVNVLEAARIIEAPANRKIKASLGVSLNITCAARGNPVPDVIWTKSGSGEVLVQGKGMARLQFAKLLEKNLGNYTCNATNYKTAVMKFSISDIGSDVGAQSGDKGISKQALVGIICGFLALVLIVIVIGLVSYARQKKQIEEYKELYFLKTGNSDSLILR